MLAEALLSVAVTAIALLAFAAGIPVAASAVQIGKQQSTAAFLAEQRLEEVRAADWFKDSSGTIIDCVGVSASPTSAPVGAAGSTCNGAANATTFPDEPTVGGWAIARTVRVTDCGVAPGCGAAPNAITDGNLRLVTITTATSGGPQTRTVTLFLLITRK